MSRARIQDYPVGEIFEYDGRKFKALPESFVCDGCHFAVRDVIDCGVMPCRDVHRDDYQNVIFKEVSDD